jgi:hypothetical protein
MKEIVVINVITYSFGLIRSEGETEKELRLVKECEGGVIN